MTTKEKYIKKEPQQLRHEEAWEYASRTREVEEFNALPLEERKRIVIEGRKRKARTAAKDIARVAVVLGVPALIGHEVTGAPLHVQHSKDKAHGIEKQGWHDGSVRMPSEKHLNQFANERGVDLNQK
jgi:ferric-dicitrate binding protein FerR (iron transport regulator)